jgi:hypothetical protein
MKRRLPLVSLVPVMLLALLAFSAFYQVPGAQAAQRHPLGTYPVSCNLHGDTAVGVKDSTNTWQCYDGTGDIPISNPVIEVCPGVHEVSVSYKNGSRLDTFYIFPGNDNCSGFIEGSVLEIIVTK